MYTCKHVYLHLLIYCSYTVLYNVAVHVNLYTCTCTCTYNYYTLPGTCADAAVLICSLHTPIDQNKMTPVSLSIVFGPNVFRYTCGCTVQSIVIHFLLNFFNFFNCPTLPLTEITQSLTMFHHLVLLLLLLSNNLTDKSIFHHLFTIILLLSHLCFAL